MQNDNYYEKTKTQSQEQSPNRKDPQIRNKFDGRTVRV